MNDKCLNHLDFTGQVCPDCKDDVDHYGNTCNQMDYCSFPDCGCDGERLCMVDNSNENAKTCCVEGMWEQKTEKQKNAVKTLVMALAMQKNGNL